MGFSVTFVRHGETEFNRNDLVHGSSNGSINETGVMQATKLGKSLENEVFTRIFSSDLERCRDTAKHALGQLKTPVPEITFDVRLREKDFGEWEGKPNSVIMKAMIEQKCDPIKLSNPGGENYDDIMTRVEEFFKDLLKISDETDRDENILIFSHGMTIQCFLRYLEKHRDIYDLGDFKYNLLKRAHNTCTTRISIEKASADGKRKMEIAPVFDCSHLGIENSDMSAEEEEQIKEKIRKFISLQGLPAKQ